MNNIKTDYTDFNKQEQKSKEEYLKWREEIFKRYEQNQIEYNKEMQELFGYTNQ